MVFHIYTFRKPNISLAPENTKNDDVPKIQNRAYLAKTWFFLEILCFTKFITCTVLPRNDDICVKFPMSHDILRANFGSKVVQFTKDWTIWRVPKTSCFLASFCVQKSYAFCEGWNDLGDRKSDIFARFWHKFWFSDICLTFGATRSASVI